MSNLVKIAALAALSLSITSGAFAATKKHPQAQSPAVENAHASAATPEPSYFAQAKGSIDE